MYNDVPFELEETFVLGFEYVQLVNYSHVCQKARRTVQGILASRCNSLLVHFFRESDIPGFWTVLNHGRGGLTGSGAYWVTDRGLHNDVLRDLNAVVGAGHGNPVRQFLAARGWTERAVTGRIPVVLHTRNGMRRNSHDIGSPYADLHWVFSKPHRPDVSLTETGDEAIFRHVAGANHTMATMLLTSSAIIALHGSEVGRKVYTWRAGVDTLAATHSDRIKRVAEMGGWDTQYTDKKAPCRKGCPGLLRRLRGGRGVGLMAWGPIPSLIISDTEADTVLDGLIDTVGVDAYFGFQQNRYAFGWTWAVCDNEYCETFLFPKDLASAFPTRVVLSHNPKENRVLRTNAAIEGAMPPFHTTYVGLLFATSCSTPYSVCVPLDHGIAAYGTTDDLLTHPWITPRVVGLPAYPVFMPPPTLVGGTTIFNAFSLRLPLGACRFLLVFMSSIHSVGPLNTLLRGEAGTGRPIHGDVLFMLEEQGSIRDLNIDAVLPLKALFASVWASMKEGDPVGGYYVSSF
ncbi:hypothetical protein C8F04DRAFT_1258909 [Mycena alexandri]|uniref:Uncharacterized protein n=1 Tax=Mycena alexandri TaxID=1745969 RepID=A0AAD6T0Z6_9AGAR|nr:hypothetical protein C8F04DRAFT_1258909 [Mycena alexandri]